MNARLSQFRALLEKREIDAALITNEKNIAYLCGYFYDDGYLWIDSKDAYLVTDFRYAEEAEKYSTDFSVVTPAARFDFLRDVIQKNNIVSLGFESRDMTVSEYRSFESELALTFVPMGDLLEEMRAQKGEEEIAAIKNAQAIAERAFSHLLSVITPTMTEKEVALELSYFMQKNGAQNVSFDIIAASGEASALPHAKCRNTRLSKGFLTLDFGCVYNGYCSDMTRTLAVGKADAEMKRLYQTVLDAQLAAISSIRAGVICSEVDAVARDLINGRGYEGAFGHSLGHGVGLDIHELPALSPRATERRLALGNIVTVEPGIYLRGKYGCRIEDMGCVKTDGFENFTTATKELIELFV